MFVNEVIIGSDNGWIATHCQDIISTNDGLLLIGLLKTT